MPWVPQEECDECGSQDMRLVPDDDPSVGYYNSVWVCANGHNVEMWVPNDPKEEVNATT